MRSREANRNAPSPAWLSGLVYATPWRGAMRWVAWLVSLGGIAALGLFRTATDAELSIASLALLPVIVVAWGFGIRSGLFASLLAAAMWVVGDIASDRHFSAAWIPWANGATRLTTYGLVAYLVDRVHLLAKFEHENAMTDALTGLRNRRSFFAAGQAEVDRASRYGHSLAVVAVDLDNFKKLNDTLGHDAGDAALRAAGRSMLSALRASDHVARIGGDEFAILLPEISYDAAAAVGRKISVAVNKALEAFPPARASIGVGWFPEAVGTFDAMLKVTDKLMYEAKRSGDDNVRLRRFDSSHIVG